jgi:hypothetical protein|tara:strand:+ start:694 stop:1023 length:330 start_codon:yes stop_codon:yes gene_type:complete
MEEDFSKVPKELSEEEKMSHNYNATERGARNWLSSMLLDLKGRGVDIEDYVSQLIQETDDRWNICKDCPSLMSFNRCKECGCFMKIKTKIPTMKCPLDKWNEFKPKLKR